MVIGAQVERSAELEDHLLGLRCVDPHVVGAGPDLRVISCVLNVWIEWVAGRKAAAGVIYVNVVLHRTRGIEITQVQDKS